MTTVAFIGLGRMGTGMAARQAAAGRVVKAYDLCPDAVKAAVAGGCVAARSVGEAVDGVDVVITMLPAGRHVRAVVTEEVLPHAKSGALIIDCSTIDVATARDLAGAAAEAGLAMADAPVSGGVMAADAGTLTFMAGCQDDAVERVSDALFPMAKAVVHAGAPGAGQAAKICNNMVLGVTMLGVCEAFALAEKLGLDAGRFFEIASQSSGQCWSISTYCPWPGVGPSSPADRGYEGGFLTSLMLKDLKLAQEAAAQSGAATPMGAQAQALYALFDRLGCGAKDFSSALEVLRGRLGPLLETPA